MNGTYIGNMQPANTYPATNQNGGLFGRILRIWTQTSKYMRIVFEK